METELKTLNSGMIPTCVKSGRKGACVKMLPRSSIAGIDPQFFSGSCSVGRNVWRTRWRSTEAWRSIAKWRIGGSGPPLNSTVVARMQATWTDGQGVWNSGCDISATDFAKLQRESRVSRLLGWRPRRASFLPCLPETGRFFFPVAAQVQWFFLLEHGHPGASEMTSKWSRVTGGSQTPPSCAVTPLQDCWPADFLGHMSASATSAPTKLKFWNVYHHYKFAHNGLASILSVMGYRTLAFLFWAKLHSI